MNRRMDTAAGHPAPLVALYRRLMRSAGDQAPRLRASLVGLAGAAVLQGLALACVVPLLVAAATPAIAVRWLAGMAALALAATALRWRAQGFDYDGHMAAATHALRTRLGEQLRRMPLEAVQDKRAGEVNATLLGNVDENFNYVLTVANMILQALVTPVVVALAMLVADWRLGLLVLLLFPVVIALYRRRQPFYGRDMRLLAEAHERTNGDILEYVQGLPSLRAARSEGPRAAVLQAGFAHLKKVQGDSQSAGSLPSLAIASVVELGLLLVVAIGACWVARGSLDLAVLAAVLVLLVRVAEPLATFVTYTAVFQLIDSALERIEALLAVQPLALRLPARRPTHFDVRFDQVEFRHVGAAHPSIRRLSAELPACGLTALVGPSGSGKSTLARLLMRHADVQQGAIAIGGVDLREMTSETLHGLISVVFQDVYLFDDTVLANLRMARPQATDAQVRAAARAAQCLEFIERLPQGWHTRLGDIGGRLSGGERQRISIARALLKDAPIVILDEPTAALDTESEVAVQAAIDALVRDKTVIVIAHRLSTIAAADLILVLDDGQIVQQGRHAQLIEIQGRYRSMWEAQGRVKRWRPIARASTVFQEKTASLIPAGAAIGLQTSLTGPNSVYIMSDGPKESPCPSQNKSGLSRT